MDYLIAVLIVVGSAFALVAALGVLRMPDFYMRMHAATKAGAFGALLLLVAAALYFGTLRAVITSILVIIFFYITTPVAAQTLAESAYRRGVKLWDRSLVDKLAESGEIPKDKDSE
ncbi:MAG: Na+/H+ antiporter subunit G [Verrucomicrobia bacterium]|jgi:multicomponent Na+:H+ antiporter subunit G|nr:Na+/H+ antiporter subunit G [Verrucomicrobiota bacterium]